MNLPWLMLLVAMTVCESPGEKLGLEFSNQV